jgi:hypothetical protein
MRLHMTRHVRDDVVVRAEGAGRRDLVLLLLVAAAAGGCSKQETGTQATTIGAAGGTVTADDSRARLEIPPGALSAATAIRITPASSSRTGLLPGMAYDFQPDGLVFAKPATLTLRPPPGVSLDAQSVIVHLTGNAVQFDEAPGVDVSAQTMSAQLSGFSTHAGASAVTLCPGGCPSVPTVTATPVQAGYIELTGSCSANGRGTTANLIVERAFVPALSSVLSDFQNWSTDATFAAPPSNVEGGCSYLFDDHDVCLGWTYAYRVRANTLQTTTNASNIALAIGPGTRQCTVPGGGGDGGTPDAGPGGSATVTIHTYQRDGWKKPVPTNAAWVGSQDGTGAFAPLTGQAGLYSFQVQDATGRYGVAVACTARTPADARVIQATTIEGTDIHVVCSGPAPATVPTNVTTLNCTNSTYSFGSNTHFGSQCGTSSQQFEGGPHDVVGVSTAGSEFIRVLVEHNVSGPLTLDFQGAGSAAAVTKQVTVAPNGRWISNFQTAAGFFLYPALPGSGPYPCFPASVRGPDDIHEICTVDVNDPSRTSYVCHFFKDPVDIDDSTAPYAAKPTPSSDKTQVSWSPYLASGFDISISAYRIWLSIGWLGQTVNYRYPRLCDLTGFPLPCVDSTTDTQYAFRAYKPAQGFVASLVDIQNGENLPAVIPDGLTYAVALAVGSL